MDEEVLRSPSLRGTAFEPLADEAVFSQIRVDLGAVPVPMGADRGPDAMQDVRLASGKWVLE